MTLIFELYFRWSAKPELNFILFTVLGSSPIAASTLSSSSEPNLTSAASNCHLKESRVSYPGAYINLLSVPL